MIRFQGELGRRLRLNAARVGEPLYCAPNVFRPAEYDWHGDFEGRTLLALVSLWKATGTEPASLRALADGLDGHCNRDGYFGPLFDGKVALEQQLSGNSWYLRGLTEYYKATKDEKSLCRIRTIARNYLAKLTGFFERYPIEREKSEEGGVFGHTLDVLNGWKLSSDTGCAFIAMDGISAVYEITRDAALKELLNVMLRRFLEIDKLALRTQTHASLSAARGILRLYECTKDDRSLQQAVREFGFYREHGMTLTYANFNWYGREDTWTEPCAIVDSLILALKLHACTGKDEYLACAYRVYYNALRMSQRGNGGAGCDLCATKDFPFVKPYNDTFEAYLCCTLRLSEGLYELGSHFVREERDAVRVLFYDDFEYISDNARIRVAGDLFYKREIALEEAETGGRKLYLYLPSYVQNIRAEGVRITREGDWALAEGTGKLSFDICVHTENGLYFYGDLLLVEPCQAMRECVRCTVDGKMLTNVPDFSRLSEKEARSVCCRIPVLFDKNSPI